MANIVIVSSHCYILCEAINHINVDIMSSIAGNYDEDDRAPTMAFLNKAKNRRTKKSVKRITKKLSEEKQRLANNFYKITINFVPVNRNSQGRNDDVRIVEIVIQGQDKAMNLYQEMINQIREQLPDQLFLDSLVSKLLEGSGDDNQN